MRIAVLDNDRNQTELVCQVLSTAGHGCQPFSSSRELMAQARRDSFDMLIIHWQLPDGGAADVVRWVRDRFSPTFPIMFITGRSNEDDIVAGVAAGADDYMIKPLRPSELIARVQALLRRAYPGAVRDQLFFDPYRFEPAQSIVSFTIAGKAHAVPLTQKEFDLALLLFRNAGRPLSRSHIREAVWGSDVDIPSRTMDTHVSRIRTKLELRPEIGYRVMPVYSYGYRLDRLEDAAREAADPAV